MSRQTARDALGLIRALYRQNFDVVGTVIEEMDAQECAVLAIDLASFAAIWVELYAKNIRGDVEEEIARCLDRLQ